MGNTFGYYVIAGSGWYRHASISKSTFIPTATVWLPIYGWCGYTCSNGYVKHCRYNPPEPVCGYLLG